MTRARRSLLLGAASALVLTLAGIVGVRPGEANTPWAGTLLINSAGACGADPYFSNVVLLGHFDGTNGTTTFTDNSSAAHTLTSGSGALLTTANQKWGTASLNASTTNVQYVSSADSADWDFGSGQFTIETWIYPTSTPANLKAIISQWDSSNDVAWIWRWTGASTLAFSYSTTGANVVSVSGTFSPTLNTWNYIGVKRDGSNNLSIWVNGSQIATATASATFHNSALSLNINNDSNGVLSHSFLGLQDDVRITKGVARDLSVVPTCPFPNG